MSANDGGPVFPQPNEQRYADPVHGVIRPSDMYGDAPSGLSLRDYFAAQALIGLCIATIGTNDMNDLADGVIGGKQRVLAAYALADSMLAARNA